MTSNNKNLKSLYNQFITLSLFEKLGYPQFRNLEQIVLNALITKEPVALIGSPNNGKKHFVKQLAKILGKELLVVDCRIRNRLAQLNDKDKIKSILNVKDFIVIDYLNLEFPEIDEFLFLLFEILKEDKLEIKNSILIWGIFQDFVENSNRYDWFSYFIKFYEAKYLNYEDRTKILLSDFKISTQKYKRLLNELIMEGEKSIKSVTKSNFDKNVISYVLCVVDQIAEAGLKTSTNFLTSLYRKLKLQTLLSDNLNENLLETFLDASFPYSKFNHPGFEKLIFEANHKAFNNLVSGKHNLLDAFKNEENFVHKFIILVDANKKYNSLDSIIFSLFDVSGYISPHNKAFLFAVFPLMLKGILNVSRDCLEQVFQVVKGFYSYTDEVILKKGFFPVGAANEAIRIIKLIESFPEGRQRRAKMLYSQLYDYVGLMSERFLRVERRVETLADYIRNLNLLNYKKENYYENPINNSEPNI